MSTRTPLSRPATRTHTTDFEQKRIRTAYHEAAHAVTARLLGREVSLVSLQPERDHLGVVHNSVAHFDGPVGDPTLPLRGEYRDELETEIIIALAGSLAEEYCLPRSGYLPTTLDEDWAQRASELLAEQSPRHRELVERAQRGEIIWPDGGLLSECAAPIDRVAGAPLGRAVPAPQRPAVRGAGQGPEADMRRRPLESTPDAIAAAWFSRPPARRHATCRAG
jgi:hypothetical protein